MRSKAKISFVELVRPDYFWPQPYTLEQAFGVLQWLVKTCSPYGGLRTSGPICTLSRKPTCVGFTSIAPIESLDDLRQRFHFALLSGTGGSETQKWRDAERVHIGESRIIRFPHHNPFEGGEGWNCEADIGKALEKLFHDGRHSRLAVQLNPRWDAARECHKVIIHVLPASFFFYLRYGFNGSAWTHELARTKDNEPFLCTMRRAVDAFYGLIEKDAA